MRIFDNRKTESIDIYYTFRLFFTFIQFFALSDISFHKIL